MKMSMTREEKLKYIAEHYMPFMWKKAYSVISDAHEAEDACQEAFIKLMRVVDNIDNIEETRVRALCVIAAQAETGTGSAPQMKTDIRKDHQDDQGIASYKCHIWMI